MPASAGAERLAPRPATADAISMECIRWQDACRLAATANWPSFAEDDAIARPLLPFSATGRSAKQIQSRKPINECYEM
jgi:hypothetical protein